MVNNTIIFVLNILSMNKIQSLSRESGADKHLNAGVGREFPRSPGRG